MGIARGHQGAACAARHGQEGTHLPRARRSPPSPSRHRPGAQPRTPHARGHPRQPGQVEESDSGTPVHARPGRPVPARRRGQTAKGYRDRHTGPPDSARSSLPARGTVRAHQSHLGRGHPPSYSRQHGPAAGDHAPVLRQRERRRRSNRRAVCCRTGRNVRTRLRHASCCRGS